MTDRLVKKIKERITALKRECEPFNTTRIHELEQVLKLIEETEDGRRFGRDDLGRCRMRGCNLCDVRKEQLQKKWIPASKSLPTKRDWYLALFEEPDTGFVGLPVIADYLLGKHTAYTTEDGWIIANCTDSEDGGAEYWKKLKCIAWQPLPPAWEGEKHG